MSAHDDIIEALRLRTGGKMDALADALDLTPENREWFRRQRLKEFKPDIHARARVDARLMRDELGIPENMRVSFVSEHHYGGFPTDHTLNILDGEGGKSITDKADAHEAWIREDPQRLTKHLTYIGKLPKTDFR